MKFTIQKNRKELKQHLKDSLYRNYHYLMANSIIGSGLGFFFWIVVARFYDASDIGLAVALISSVAIVTSISRFGVDVSIIRFLSKEKDKGLFINTCLTVVGVATIKSVTLEKYLSDKIGCVVIITDHSTYDYKWIYENSRLILDTKNVIKGKSEKIVKL